MSQQPFDVLEKDILDDLSTIGKNYLLSPNDQIALQQVHATMLVATQLNRLNDLFESIVTGKESLQVDAVTIGKYSI